MADDNDLSKLGVAGALAQNYAEDARGFLPLLAMVLEAAVPRETSVERKGGLFQKTKHVVKITVTVQDDVYMIEDTGQGALQAQRTKIVRGIRLKTETVPIDQWLHALSEEISRRALVNEKSFFALKELLRL